MDLKTHKLETVGKWNIQDLVMNSVGNRRKGTMNSKQFIRFKIIVLLSGNRKIGEKWQPRFHCRQICFIFSFRQLIFFFMKE